MHEFSKGLQIHKKVDLFDPGYWYRFWTSPQPTSMHTTWKETTSTPTWSTWSTICAFPSQYHCRHTCLSWARTRSLKRIERCSNWRLSCKKGDDLERNEGNQETLLAASVSERAPATDGTFWADYSVITVPSLYAQFMVQREALCDVNVHDRYGYHKIDGVSI